MPKTKQKPALNAKELHNKAAHKGITDLSLLTQVRVQQNIKNSILHQNQLWSVRMSDIFVPTTIRSTFNPLLNQCSYKALEMLRVQVPADWVYRKPGIPQTYLCERSVALILSKHESRNPAHSLVVHSSLEDSVRVIYEETVYRPVIMESVLKDVGDPEALELHREESLKKLPLGSREFMSDRQNFLTFFRQFLLDQLPPGHMTYIGCLLSSSNGEQALSYPLVVYHHCPKSDGLYVPSESQLYILDPEDVKTGYHFNSLMVKDHVIPLMLSVIMFRKEMFQQQRVPSFLDQLYIRSDPEELLGNS